MKNLTFKTFQYKWSHKLQKDGFWTFYAYVDDRAYEFEVEDDKITSVFQFKGEVVELSEDEINYIFEKWKNN